MTDSTPSVLVAGAGPTGLTLALALRRQGVRVRIIDKLSEPASVSKALAVWSGSMEAFATLGVVEDFLADGLHMAHLRMGDGAHEVATMAVAEGVDSAYPFALILPQSRTEEILTAHLASLGVRIERGVELADFVETQTGITATLHHADGPEETVTCAYLVGCDGARSVVRHKLDIPFEGYTVPQTFILSDTRMEGDLDPASVYIWWSSKGSVALFPVTPGVWRTFAMREEPASDAPPTVEEIQGHLDACGPPGIIAHDPTWLSAFRVNERLVARYRSGRALLAGDAAHIHSPAGGQGMNTGIQDAVNLGWKLAAVLSGRGSSEALLDSYEAERRPVAREVVAAAARTLNLGIIAHGPATRLVRHAVIAIGSRLPAVRRRMQVEMSETDIAYGEGPLVEATRRLRAAATPAVGHRARDAALAEGPLWSLLAPYGHTLLLFGPKGSQAALAAAASARAVAVLEIDEPGAAVRYDMTGGGWVLVRPDQFIAARGSTGETAAFEAYARLALDPA
ncbi:MAG: hypothetical protein B7Z15_04230 [Rhizobiales bacterium 32-66-8]|nr:MAG: hypothetical protein B7Z15_04230 [Rhizobiales bacterium 32-66-8]